MNQEFADFVDSLPSTHRTRIRNVFINDGITSFEKLLSLSDYDLISAPLFGRKYLVVVDAALAVRGLRRAKYLRDGTYPTCPTCGQSLRAEPQETT